MLSEWDSFSLKVPLESGRQSIQSLYGTLFLGSFMQVFLFDIFTS